ncbi:hypothetical protein [Rhodococcus sp. JS3073]|uniref:hypothetical protein n=1 Tax=Rhodococcus sp. JS3073 TaxID=3002901 RepID=UPI002285633E|nr:hypothetical protein [Rhodococcus sp. JS3073]WAM16754.1 hypothetical protein OYT95_09060 [Rhodococcus sp. JS3073]
MAELTRIPRERRAAYARRPTVAPEAEPRCAVERTSTFLAYGLLALFGGLGIFGTICSVDAIPDGARIAVVQTTPTQSHPLDLPHPAPDAPEPTPAGV